MIVRTLLVSAVVMAGTALPAEPLASSAATLRARYLVTVADDFVVDVYHNGVLVPDERRHLLLDRFGATAERIDLEVRDGDWLVFNVVNNRLRWDGAYYFGLAGCYAENEFGFVSERQSGSWSVCDDVSQVSRFIERRDHLSHQAPQRVVKPWGEGDQLMRGYAGRNWSGEPVWGLRRNTWVKVIVDSPRDL